MKRTFKTLLSDRRGLALITVVGTLALATILLMAIFSVTQTEYKASQSFAASQTAKQLADAATAIVQAQIQNGQNIVASASRTTHATQPGMVRVYNNTGGFLEAYKLYSSSRMKETVEANLNTDVTPPEWDQSPARYVDLNEPVVRPPLVAGGGAGPSIFFPIIDPRAAYNYLGNQAPTTIPTTQVEGFSYTSQHAVEGAPTGTIANMVLPAAAASDADLRLPMPVEWIYVLQDGTMGTLDAANNFVSTTAVTATLTNPIVGRIAFWADDESCKININTASEPTYAGTPYYYHERDRRWAHYPGASSEYQRYPGHPATVSLSAVLFPKNRLDPWSPAPLTTAEVIDIKEKIYDLAPKIEQGGSKSGSLPFGLDEVNTADTATATRIDTNDSMKERLYASVDEMLFKEGGYDVAKGRMKSEAIVKVGGVDRNLFDHDVLERSRFFLTANSRAPEFSIHGLPRIAMWPIADEGQGPTMRTNFDNLIALCSTLKSGSSGPAINHSYIFRRASSSYGTYDVDGKPVAGSGLLNSTGLQRNERLLNYFEKEMTQLSFPKTSPLTTGAGDFTNFGEKYGVDNVRQLGISIFDYIRCINLYDGILARGNDGMAASGQSGEALYNTASTIAHKTFTNPRVTPGSNSSVANSDDSSVIPGHGVVSPAIWAKDGKNYKGFGRMFTISEVGLQFICTADGLNTKDPTSPTSRHYPVDMNGEVPPSGGQSAPRLNFKEPSSLTNEDEYPGYTLPAPAAAPVPTGVPDYYARWYSNFPVPSFDRRGVPQIMIGKYGVDDSMEAIDANGVPTTNLKHPSKHLGFNPGLWNHTLERDTPMTPNQKRVQAVLQLEAFCPSLGWTKFFPEFTIVLDGDYARGIRLNGEILFDTTGPIPIKSNGNIFEDGGNGVLPLGGSSGVDMLLGGRGTRGVGDLPPDEPRYDSNPSNKKHSHLSNFDLVSNFITVDVGADRANPTPMELTFPANRPLQIKIYDSHDTSGDPIQILNVQFPSTLRLPAPKLVGADDVTTGKFFTDVDGNGNRYYDRRREGPHWWIFNYYGSLGRKTGEPNPAYKKGGGGQSFWSSPVADADMTTDLAQRTRGRLDNTIDEKSRPQGSPKADGYARSVPLIPDAVSDVVRTMIPAMGDYRMSAALYDVPASMWRPHPSWEDLTVREAHNYTRHSNDVLGSQLKTGPVGNRALVANISTYADARLADIPNDTNVSKLANAFGDFDAGIGNARDGAYINKPDEGNFFIGRITRGTDTKNYRAGYFYDSWRQTDDWRSGVFMTPNRLVSSPVMLGSLPTAVWPGSGVDGSGAGITPTAFGGEPAPQAMEKATSYQPWQTLLFRPYVKNLADVVISGVSSKAQHPGEKNPQDHYLLDLFFMPVVEPYAISEPLSEAGKININYQIMPFSYIRRATGMHAVLKGEFMTAIRNADVTIAKTFKPGAPGDWSSPPPFYKESDNKFWHRPIDPEQTLKQFDERMNFKDAALPANQKGLFRAASQICETHMMPLTGLPGGIDPVNSTYFTNPALTSASARKTKMQQFWSTHSGTPENIRERPYSNIYSRITTRSNTFRVHVRAQVIKKARSTGVNSFEPGKDAVLSEYRGSTLLERFIDPTDPDKPIPDYGASDNPLALAPLDTFYQFRTLETKRFAP